MGTLREELDAQVGELRAAREELEVRLHLGKLEAQDLWKDLEKEWGRAEGKLKVIGDAAEEALEDVGEAAQLVLDQIKSGYERLRRLL